MARFKVQLDLDIDVDAYAKARGLSTADTIVDILAQLRNREVWEPRLTGRHVSVADARAQLELFGGMFFQGRLSADELPTDRT